MGRLTVTPRVSTRDGQCAPRTRVRLGHCETAAIEGRTSRSPDRQPQSRSRAPLVPSGTAVCKLRIASNTRRKNSTTGEWHEVPNYFDVAVWGSQGENCARARDREAVRADRQASCRWRRGQRSRLRQVHGHAGRPQPPHTPRTARHSQSNPHSARATTRSREASTTANRPPSSQRITCRSSIRPGNSRSR